jgi:hypothetical protein
LISGSNYQCGDTFCDSANGFSQTTGLQGTTPANRRVCIPTTELKPDCNSYLFDATFNVYKCKGCATAGNIRLTTSLTPTTIKICIKAASPLTGCELYANNPAEAICLQCSVGFFAAKDQA